MLKYHIQTVQLTSAQADISFNSIPQDYTDLVAMVSARSTSSTVSAFFSLAFNGSTTNFTARGLYGNPPTVASFTTPNNFGSEIAGGSSTSATFANSSLYISNYTTSANKSFSADGVGEHNGAASNLTISSGLWSNTAPITNITFIPNSNSFASGTSISLYGVKRGSDGVVNYPATGGTVTTSGGYTIHTFNSSGTFFAARPLDVEYLVVAGGAAGGSYVGGGGGAGGYRSSVVGESSGGGTSAEAILSLNAGTSHTVTVGAGGAATVAGTTTPGNGSNSVFGSITSTGGGRGSVGGGASNWIAATGGSGGGGGSTTLAGAPTGAAGTANQGFAGGNSPNPQPPNYPSGGGGGAGQIGLTPTSSAALAGNGGSGVQSSITGSATFRAGGGGGSNADSAGNAAGVGGSGGGGNGSWHVTATGAYKSGGTNGIANTGGGGGGGFANSAGDGLAGGSGVVIIRYLTP